MISAVVPRLINGPFGDPGLHISFKWEARAIQFDLGRMDRFPAADILKLNKVFVSHTHMDHFYGFDRLLRLFLARDAKIDLYGPPGIIGNVQGKIAGYTWNLTDGYPFIIDVHEVTPSNQRSVRMAATNAFRIEELGDIPLGQYLAQDDAFCIRTTHLDHRIPCMAYLFEERSRLNVRATSLDQMGLPAGRWLNELKAAIRAGAPDDSPIDVVWREQGNERHTRLALGTLRDELIVETPGQRIGYVVDTLFSRDNAEKLAALLEGADVLYCESLFLDEDRHEALKRYHLTARQAGTLARTAGVKSLRTFHFSPRYDGRADELYAEAQATFRGETSPDTPY